jgi:hypothetical protein
MLQTRERISGKSLDKADPPAGALGTFEEPVSETLSVRAVPSWRADTEHALEPNVIDDGTRSAEGAVALSDVPLTRKHVGPQQRSQGRSFSRLSPRGHPGCEVTRPACQANRGRQPSDVARFADEADR